MEVGCTFLLPDSNIGAHLWIVLSNPDEEGWVVIASVSTRRSMNETVCVLNEGDHPFIRHESVVRYDRARFVKADFLKKYAKPQEVCSESMLRRVYSGASRSERMPMDAQEYLRDQGLIE